MKRETTYSRFVRDALVLEAVGKWLLAAEAWKVAARSTTVADKKELCGKNQAHCDRKEALSRIDQVIA